MVNPVSNSVVSGYQRVDENRNQDNKKAQENRTESREVAGTGKTESRQDRSAPVQRSASSSDDTREKAAPRQRGSLVDLKV